MQYCAWHVEHCVCSVQDTYKAVWHDLMQLVIHTIMKMVNHSLITHVVVVSVIK